MPRRLVHVLRRIHELAAAGEIQLTHKAVREALMLHLAPEDVRDVLGRLEAEDSVGASPGLRRRVVP